jgi:hypothetical protein
MSLFQMQSKQRAASLAAAQTERRAHTRFFLQGTAVVRILPYGPDVLGALQDLSEGGCGVELGIAIPAQVGTRVEVDLNVRGVTMKRVGVIRRIDVTRRIERETRAGIEFTEPANRSTDQNGYSVNGLLRQLETNRPLGA